MQALTDFLPFILVFAAVALFVVAIGSLIPAVDPVRRRLADDRPEREGRRVALRGSQENSLVRALLRPFAHYSAPDNKGQLSALRLNLIRAGFHSLNAPAVYYAIRTALAVALPIAASFFTPFLAGRFPSSVVLGGVLVFGLLGYMVPVLIVSSRVKSRQRTIREDFPEALDMLLMCVEAGVGLDEAVTRVGEELKLGHPLLGSHFELLSAELRAGKTRENAFRAMSERIAVDEIRSFVSLLMQTESLGTSMADTLRSMSDDMRQRRLLRAEEMAQKVSTKLSMLLMAFILPVLLMVIIAPAALSAMKAFQHMQLHH